MEPRLREVMDRLDGRGRGGAGRGRVGSWPRARLAIPVPAVPAWQAGQGKGMFPVVWRTSSLVNTYISVGFAEDHGKEFFPSTADADVDAARAARTLTPAAAAMSKQAVGPSRRPVNTPAPGSPRRPTRGLRLFSGNGGTGALGL